VAVYECPSATLTVSATSLDGAPLGGLYTTLSLSDGVPIQACFSICSFTVDAGQAYIVTIANYGGESFTEWGNRAGIAYSWGGSHFVSVPSASEANFTISLVAVYSP